MNVPDLNSPNHLRHVRLEGGYTLRTWDTNTRDSYGKWTLGYQFAKADGTVLFEGEDFHCAPSDAVDSDAALRSILTFLTLRPGDTDAEYFADYTPEQLAFCNSDAEHLQLYALDEDPLPFENLDGWESSED